MRILRTIWAWLTRKRAVAPFVLEIDDQLLVFPENWLVLRTDEALVLRAVNGNLAKQGVVLTVTRQGVRLSTHYFEDVPLPLREQQVLMDGVEYWMDQFGDENELKAA
jgi:hypothetical protein